MSMYGESEYAGEKNYLFDEIIVFVFDYSKLLILQRLSDVLYLLFNFLIYFLYPLIPLPPYPLKPPLLPLNPPLLPLNPPLLPLNPPPR